MSPACQANKRGKHILLIIVLLTVFGIHQVIGAAADGAVTLGADGLHVRHEAYIVFISDDWGAFQDSSSRKN